MPVPGSRFTVLGNASPADTGGPTLTIDSQVVTIRGVTVQTEGVGLWVGRFVAKDKLVEVSHAPVHITVARAPKGPKAGSPWGSSDSGH